MADAAPLPLSPFRQILWSGLLSLLFLLVCCLLTFTHNSVWCPLRYADGTFCEWLLRWRLRGPEHKRYIVPTFLRPSELGQYQQSDRRLHDDDLVASSFICWRAKPCSSEGTASGLVPIRAILSVIPQKYEIAF